MASAGVIKWVLMLISANENFVSQSVTSQSGSLRTAQPDADHSTQLNFTNRMVQLQSIALKLLF